MPRYFLEVAYKGTNYSGFQIQDNASSIQQEVQKALAIFLRQQAALTTSSRTDGGVHALQNFFHFDYEGFIDKRSLYNLNAILPSDIVLKDIRPVAPDAHCRFDAISREYRYYLYNSKNPFQDDRAWFYPYTLELHKLAAAAALLMEYQDFTAFAKRNTQVKTFICALSESNWREEGNGLVYTVKANRFLRGMVRGLVGTMLHVGRGKLSLAAFAGVLAQKDNRLADFSAPGHGLFLHRVYFPVSVYDSSI
jgi:tRNA pseudouridine38-40 synthase